MVAYPELRERGSVFDAIRWRFVAIVIIIAMLVSIISGGLSGIKFGTIMIRALVGGGAFAILAIVLNLVFAMLFPDILEGRTAYEEDVAGGQVDIGIPPISPMTENDDEGPTSRAEGMDEREQADSEDVIDIDSEAEDSQLVDNSDETLNDLPGDSFGADHSTGGISLNPNGSGEVHAAEDIARAIHTVMSKDEKG